METVKRMLVVVDMQNDFIDGVLGTEEAKAIVPNVINKIDEYISRRDIVLFTKDVHGDEYFEMIEGQKLPITHCVKGSDGAEIIQVIKDMRCTDFCTEKRTFGAIHLVTYPLPHNCVSIEVIGVCTDCCVISNAILLRNIFPYTKIVVDASCCAGTTPENHKIALQAMKNCMIDVIGEE